MELSERIYNAFLGGIVNKVVLAEWFTDAKQLEAELSKANFEVGWQMGEKETLTGFIAVVLCWKPEWAQTPYFKNLPEKMRNDLVELAKLTKHEGSGGIDNEWLDALLEEKLDA